MNNNEPGGVERTQQRPPLHGGQGRMWLAVLLGLVLGWGASRAGGAESGEARRDAVVRAVERVMPSVVNIATEEVVAIHDPIEDLFREFFDPYYRGRPMNRQYSLGSGVIIDEEGYLLTNYHVVARARRVWVRLHSGGDYEAEKVSGTSLTDVALLKIQSKEGEKFAPVRFAADDDLHLGETVLALGNPFGLGGSVSRGILSSRSRRPPREGEFLNVQDWLQTDAAINPGNSGGPLVNLDGNLIGINVAVYREGQGIGFAIPVKRLTEGIAEIFSPEWMEELWFGARLRPGRQPLEVISVMDGSPASTAGLKAGDRIVSVDGRVPTGFFQCQRWLIEAGTNQPVALEVERAGERKRAQLRMVPEKSFFNEALIRRVTGASVQELTPDLARVMGLRQVRGLLIAEVDERTASAKAGLNRGMVITRINGKFTTDLVEVARLLHGRKSGETLQVDLVVPRQRGLFLFLEEAKVELVVP